MSGWGQVLMSNPHLGCGVGLEIDKCINVDSCSEAYASKTNPFAKANFSKCDQTNKKKKKQKKIRQGWDSNPRVQSTMD